ncbi:hypothetical protein Fot_00634 [Forsythia ovata]|uniref:Uncharacterized protein n=1 Tax=Forsythia ovata TaxID=205694 RepID=A0ABD1X2I9_9LAMI
MESDFLQDIGDRLGSVPGKGGRLHIWNPLTAGCLKLNINAVVSLVDGVVGVGAITRDHLVEWVVNGGSSDFDEEDCWFLIDRGCTNYYIARWPYICIIGWIAYTQYGK